MLGRPGGADDSGYWRGQVVQRLDDISAQLKDMRKDLNEYRVAQIAHDRRIDRLEQAARAHRSAGDSVQRWLGWIVATAMFGVQVINLVLAHH
jgi:hypothetical protein